jgi:hypothetical protein
MFTGKHIAAEKANMDIITKVVKLIGSLNII